MIFFELRRFVPVEMERDLIDWISVDKEARPLLWTLSLRGVRTLHEPEQLVSPIPVVFASFSQ